MVGWEAIIIGGGPAGLSAGLYLSRGKRRTLLLEKEGFGGAIKNLELIENYPGFANGVPGAHLASEMLVQATKYGLKLKQTEVQGIEIYSSCMSVQSNQDEYVAPLIIIAGGARPKKLGVPGEQALQGRGVFTCAMCDGGQFEGRVVAMCGSGDSALTEALYLTKLASRVVLIARSPVLRATAVLQERALANPKLEIRRGVKVQTIVGDGHVEALEIVEAGSEQMETLKVDGVLVKVGVDPNTNYLEGVVPLNEHGQVIVNERMETAVPYILAAGDIRSGSPKQAVTAVGDGAIAAITAERLLQKLT